jgi:hypothetical protein
MLTDLSIKNRPTVIQIAGESDRRHFLKMAGYGTAHI